MIQLSNPLDSKELDGEKDVYAERELHWNRNVLW
jgi:hypothetical protein